MIPLSPLSLIRSRSVQPPANQSRGLAGRAIALFKLTADHLAIGVVLLACPMILSGVALHLA